MESKSFISPLNHVLSRLSNYVLVASWKERVGAAPPRTKGLPISLAAQSWPAEFIAKQCP